MKINGFRIEIGDIENALLRASGVRQGAVVIAERPDKSNAPGGLLRQRAGA